MPYLKSIQGIFDLYRTETIFGVKLGSAVLLINRKFRYGDAKPIGKFAAISNVFPVSINRLAHLSFSIGRRPAWAWVSRFLY
jgi:hypothetical protein